MIPALIIFVVFSCWVVFAFMTGKIAESRGRSEIGWFWIGFLAGIPGLIVLYCLPNLSYEEPRLSEGEAKIRRLRNQLREE